MTVRELVATLSRCNPDDTVICDARSEALLVIGIKPGMHQECGDANLLVLTGKDAEFLNALRIRPDR
jgi:hypothetical protein